MTENNEKLDFSKFSDWLKGEDSWHGIEALSNNQQNIVERNMNLLLKSGDWKNRVNAFENELSKIKNEDNREKERKKFIIHFDRCEFNLGSSLNLLNYEFPCSTSFEGVNFGKYGVDFSRAKFNADQIIFDRSEFGSGDVYFYKTNFGNGSVYFEDVKVEGNFHVITTFNNKVSFAGLSVKGGANFSGSKFIKVPDFQDAKLDRLPEVVGMEVPRPKLKDGKWTQRIYSDGNDDNKDDVAKYRKLKSMAIAASDHVKSGEFFAYEMIAKRGVETKGKAALFFDSVYSFFSDYGQSYLRPLAWLGISWFFFACINIWKIFQELVFIGELDFWQNISFGFILSARNLIPFFNSLSRFAPSPKNHESWFQELMNRLEVEGVNINWLTSIGIIEQLIGAILLFLLLLGLRNKFRLK